MCPTNQQVEAWERIPSELVKKSSIKDKPNCPLCLFAVSKLYDLVKDDKTEVIVGFIIYFSQRALSIYYYQSVNLFIY